MKILICGHRSYAARNFARRLECSGHTVWGFSRGSVKQENNVITGPVTEMDKNPYLKDLEVDVVINFILLDGQSVEENLKYIDALCHWCESADVKRIIHMSSISVLPNETKLITEETPIDAHPELKGKYGALKVAIDNRLMEWASTHISIKVIMFRPGFITAEDKKNALAGIAIILPGGFAVLMGDNKSTLPIVDRDELQTGLQNAIEDEISLDVYLMVSEGDNTKRSYLKAFAPKAKVIPLPKSLIMFIAGILKTIGIFDERKFCIVKGLFKVQKFNACKTYNKIYNK